MDDERGGAAPLIIRDAEDLVTAIPFILGFHPDECLVAVGSGGPEGSCTARHPLPLDEGAARRLASFLVAHAFQEVLLVGYGEPAAADPAMALAREAMEHARVRVGDALRVHDGKYLSYLDPEVEGDACGATALHAQAIVEGRVALPSRASLAATIAPLPEPIASRVRAEAERAARVPWDTEAGLRVVRSVMEGVASGAPPPELARIAEFTVALSALRLRDEAWVRVEPRSLPAQREFWRYVLQRTAPAFVPAPACLLAYCSYLSGDGVMANLALDRAEEIDPAYSMADLLRQVIAAGVRPADTLVRMTPEELARAYDVTD